MALDRVLDPIPGDPKASFDCEDTEESPTTSRDAFLLFQPVPDPGMSLAAQLDRLAMCLGCKDGEDTLDQFQLIALDLDRQ